MSSFPSKQQPSASLDSTSSHPPSGPQHPDATELISHGSSNGPEGRFPTTTPSSTSQLSRGQIVSEVTNSTPEPQPSKQQSSHQLSERKASLTSAISSYPEFPEKGILFYDILPIFRDISLHTTLIDTLDLLIASNFAPENRPDIVVGLEARGFLFGPSLATRLGAGFVPVRKPGKLPGKTETAGYKKEYGVDKFEIQAEGFGKGQKVLVVDDVIATGGSAAACGELVKKLGGILLGYVFIMELEFLKGRDKLDAPVHALLSENDMEGKD